MIITDLPKFISMAWGIDLCVVRKAAQRFGCPASKLRVPTQNKKGTILHKDGNTGFSKWILTCSTPMDKNPGADLGLELAGAGIRLSCSKTFKKVIVPFHVGKYVDLFLGNRKLHFPNGCSKIRWRKPNTYQMLLTGKVTVGFPKNKTSSPPNKNSGNDHCKNPNNLISFLEPNYSVFHQIKQNWTNQQWLIKISLMKNSVKFIINLIWVANLKIFINIEIFGLAAK